MPTVINVNPWHKNSLCVVAVYSQTVYSISGHYSMSKMGQHTEPGPEPMSGTGAVVSGRV